MMAGHGHVTHNPDGSKARCGGPGVCHVCSIERSAVVAAGGRYSDPLRPPEHPALGNRPIAIEYTPPAPGDLLRQLAESAKDERVRLDATLALIDLHRRENLGHMFAPKETK